MTSPARVSIDSIKRAVADEFDVAVRDLVGTRRDRAAARPRQVAVALAMNLTPNSCAIVGRLFGGRDHSTVLASRHRVDLLRSTDPAFDRRYRRLEAKLREPLAPPRELQLTFLDGPLFDQAFGQAVAA